jgi:homoaconitase/3-isopropylmalate dehydratase large subunit
MPVGSQATVKAVTPDELKEIGIKIDQTLTQDATGTMAYLQFEAMNVPKVKTELSVSYVDHNTVQVGFENADDHKYLQSVAAKYGIILSRAGMGYAIRFILNDLENQEKHSWDQIRTHQHAVVSE